MSQRIITPLHLNIIHLTKNCILVGGFIFFAITSCGAQNTVGKDCYTPYIDIDYRRDIDIKGEKHDSITLKDYYITGELFMEASGHFKKEFIYHGLCTYYHQNGHISMQGSFYQGKQIGLWSYWSEDGNNSTIMAYEQGGSSRMISNNITHPQLLSNPIDKSDSSNTVYSYVEEDAVFPGGQMEMIDYFNQNLKYPKQAMKRGIEGRVNVYFEIDKTGKICNVRAMNIQHFGLENEALRIVCEMPQWTPAKQNGRPVRVRRILPIAFRLQ